MTCISLHLPPARSGSFSQCVRVLCLSRTAKGKTRSWHALSNEMHLVASCGYHLHLSSSFCVDLEEMDADGNGLISRTEFEDTLNDDRVLAA